MGVRDHKRAGKLAVAVLVLMLALVLGACGSDDSGTDPGGTADAPDYKPALAKAPAELKALYSDGGDTIAPGGLDGFQTQLDKVKGYPVVVNNWASWCGPCRTEWPWLQDAAAQHLDEVAFMGVDGDDTDDAANTFLSTHPIPYPSFADPDKALANAVGTTFVGGFPNTLFFDADGRLVFAHQGVYPDQAALEADIEKYALSPS